VRAFERAVLRLDKFFGRILLGAIHRGPRERARLPSDDALTGAAMKIRDELVSANVQPGCDSPMVGIVLLVIVSFLILVGSILASGLRFANAADFFVPFGGILGVLILIKAYQFSRASKNKRFDFFCEHDDYKIDNVSHHDDISV
jgi:hypothetical protein